MMPDSPGIPNGALLGAPGATLPLGGSTGLVQRVRRRASSVARAATEPAAVTAFAKWTIAAAIFMALSRTHQHIRPLGILKAPLLLSLLGSMILLAETQRWRPKQLFKHWMWKALGVLTVFAGLSVVTSIYPGRSFSFFTDGYLRALWIGVLTWALSRTRAGAHFTAKTLALSGIAAAVLALKVGRTDNEGRLSGGYTYDSNDIALIACVTLPLVYWWWVDRRNRGRWLILASLAPLLMVIVKSGSRGGFLGLATVILGFIFLGFHKVSPRLRKASIGLAVLAVLAIPLMPASYRERIASLTDTKEDYNMTSQSGRVAVWKRGMGYAISHPFTGVGIDNFRTAEGRLSDLAVNRQAGRGLKWSAAHNSYLQVLAECGFIAGFAFIILVARSIWELVVKVGRRTRAATDPDLLGPLLGISMAAYAVAGFFLSFAYYDIVYVLFGLAAAILYRELHPAAAGPRPAPANGRASGRVRRRG